MGLGCARRSELVYNDNSRGRFADHLRLVHLNQRKREEWSPRSRHESAYATRAHLQCGRKTGSSPCALQRAGCGHLPTALSRVIVQETLAAKTRGADQLLRFATKSNQLGQIIGRAWPVRLDASEHPVASSLVRRVG